MKVQRFFLLIAFSFTTFACSKTKFANLWLIGDSTMTDYANYGENYMAERYPQTGWGQALPFFLIPDSLKNISLFDVDSIRVVNKARGGRSTRSFFEEGRWTDIYNQLQPGDFVIIQFGHNDASETKQERYVSLPGYKEFLRLYVNQTREKGATPILITSVCRNYPWDAEILGNSHGEYPQAMRDVAYELSVHLIDLTEISANHFTTLGRDYVSLNYFMNLPPGKFAAYPEGLNDNTHFQPEGAEALARLVYEALKKLK
jgi:lysophospholipase L1-like esterase